MSTTKTYYITGPCKWAKLRTPDEYKGEHKWKINVYLNKDTKKQVKETGVPLKIRDDEDGDFVTFSRSVEKTFKDKEGNEKTIKFDPPKVLDADKNEIDVLIGNGSIVTAKIEVFDTAKGMAHRLEAVRVDNLIEYEGNDQQPEGAF